MRLSAASIAGLHTTITRPSYDRAAQKAGIVHFGIGAFHRAHQAVYTDDAMNAGERDWGIVGVSLRSSNVADQLNPQNGLYTVASRAGRQSELRLIGAVQHVIVASQYPEAVFAAIAAPTTHIISFTITEKGYCRKSDGTLDLGLAGESSIYSYLTAGFHRRRDAGLTGLTLLSCDNLSNNGPRLAALMSEYLTHIAPELLSWFHTECTCPSTMVDRIVPATTEADRGLAQAILSLRDDAHVVTEPFSTWVIEDHFAGPRPSWEKFGAVLVSDVAPYETAKLRMLNGAHSALAYIGLKQGHDYVHQAVSDPEIRPLIERLMREEAAPSIVAAPGQDLSAYADALMARFENSSLNHSLIQIAMDGSQKIPQRWLETLAWHQAKANHYPSILAGIAAWLLHIRGDVRQVDDPLAAQLAQIWSEAGQADIIPRLFGTGGLMASDWQPNAADIATILRQLDDKVQPLPA